MDVGAGAGELGAAHDDRQARVWGVDPDKRVRQNRNVDVPVVGTLQQAVLPKEHFDLACSCFVFEHLAEPLDALNIICDCLKPGGKLLILTVNRYHYCCYLNQLLPAFLTKRLVNRAEEDIFPVYYRFNNPLGIAGQVRRSRFGPKTTVEICLQEGLLHTRMAITRFISRMYSVVVNSTERLQWLRAGLIVEITKEQAAEPIHPS